MPTPMGRTTGSSGGGGTYNPYAADSYDARRLEEEALRQGQAYQGGDAYSVPPPPPVADTYAPPPPAPAPVYSAPEPMYSDPTADGGYAPPIDASQNKYQYGGYGETPMQGGYTPPSGGTINSMYQASQYGQDNVYSTPEPMQPTPEDKYSPSSFREPGVLPMPMPQPNYSGSQVPPGGSMLDLASTSTVDIAGGKYNIDKTGFSQVAQPPPIGQDKYASTSTWTGLGSQPQLSSSSVALMQAGDKYTDGLDRWRGLGSQPQYSEAEVKEVLRQQRDQAALDESIANGQDVRDARFRDSQRGQDYRDWLGNAWDMAVDWWNEPSKTQARNDRDARASWWATEGDARNIRFLEANDAPIPANPRFDNLKPTTDGPFNQYGLPVEWRNTIRRGTVAVDSNGNMATPGFGWFNDLGVNATPAFDAGPPVIDQRITEALFGGDRTGGLPSPRPQSATPSPRRDSWNNGPDTSMLTEADVNVAMGLPPETKPENRQSPPGLEFIDGEVGKPLPGFTPKPSSGQTRPEGANFPRQPAPGQTRPEGANFAPPPVNRPTDRGQIYGPPSRQPQQPQQPQGGGDWREGLPFGDQRDAVKGFIDDWITNPNSPVWQEWDKPSDLDILTTIGNAVEGAGIDIPGFDPGPPPISVDSVNQGLPPGVRVPEITGSLGGRSGGTVAPAPAAAAPSKPGLAPGLQLIEGSDGERFIRLIDTSGGMSRQYLPDPDNTGSANTYDVNGRPFTVYSDSDGDGLFSVYGPNGDFVGFADDQRNLYGADGRLTGNKLGAKTGSAPSSGSGVKEVGGSGSTGSGTGNEPAVRRAPGTNQKGTDTAAPGTTNQVGSSGSSSGGSQSSGSGKTSNYDPDDVDGDGYKNWEDWDYIGKPSKSSGSSSSSGGSSSGGYSKSSGGSSSGGYSKSSGGSSSGGYSNSSGGSSSSDFFEGQTVKAKGRTWTYSASDDAFYDSKGNRMAASVLRRGRKGKRGKMGASPFGSGFPFGTVSADGKPNVFSSSIFDDYKAVSGDDLAWGPRSNGKVGGERIAPKDRKKAKKE